MPNFADLAVLLRRLALDRQTKLQVLDILAANPDAKAAEDIEVLLRSYEEMDVRTREDLTKRLAGIDAAYQESLKASAAGLSRDIRVAQDEIQRNDEIERIRKSLE